MFSIFFGTPHLFIFLLLADFCARVLRGPNLRPSPVRGMCYPSPPPFPPQKGKTGGLARSRGFRARTMDTTRPPPSKPATLLARHVVRKRNFLEAFAKLRETDATTRIHRAECGYIYGCASQEIKRATFLAFYRSSTMAARACPEFSPRIVSPRQVSGIEDRASLPFRSNYYPFYIYIYISHFSSCPLVNNNFSRQIIFICISLSSNDSFFILQDIYTK